MCFNLFEVDVVVEKVFCNLNYNHKIYRYVYIFIVYI